ncbi:hypothetical protein BWQ96_08772 [Gracilariopsis chorda]|uniref:Right handed beta helix domain-containing protein n=1 Tax=Gracilariopsis chorda TaxID=448386 RepID=A0A2V3IHD1_9FLOR|nr:hypothetical protein BWQ96_08772 [Gracilariopsis chorda]|eukprot:PXF41516.1 hypothetical protein BWQ96_08772 [Gracilariopsis chorda]
MVWFFTNPSVSQRSRLIFYGHLVLLLQSTCKSVTRQGSVESEVLPSLHEHNITASNQESSAARSERNNCTKARRLQSVLFFVSRSLSLLKNRRSHFFFPAVLLSALMYRSSIPRFIGLLLVSLIVSVHAWGSNPIPDSIRPKTNWESSFPSNPTVTVQTGHSAQQAIDSCDNLVGSEGYCTVLLVGNPSDSTINIYRSRTKLTSNGAEITSSGSVTFVAVNTPYVHRVVVENLNIRGHTAANIYAIFVSGSAISEIVLRGNNIYSFNGTSNAHGIAVYGEGSVPISDVSILFNEVYDMSTGYSESIVVNGNVVRWVIGSNYVHDVNNIAIDAIGGEGTFPPSSFARLPRPSDAARKGVIEYNTVERVSTLTNPNYGNSHTWAAGIYVDGAREVLIQGNTLVGTPWGIEIGAENCVITTDVIVRYNTISNSYYGDFLIGGYNPGGYVGNGSIQCNPRFTQDADEGHGYVQRISVMGNNFSTTTGSEDNILVQYRATYAVIAQPGVSPQNENGNGSAAGDENAVRTWL